LKPTLVIAFFILLVSILPAHAVQRTVSWDAVDSYNDNTLLEPQVRATLRYDIMMDGVMLFDNVVGIDNGAGVRYMTFEHANANQDHVFAGRARAIGLDGLWAESLWSPPFNWHCPPAGTPSTTPVQPIILQIHRP